MAQYEEHETELDLVDDESVDEGLEAEDRGDELTEDQIADQHDDELEEFEDDNETDEEVDEVDDTAESDDSDSDADSADTNAKGSRVVPHSRFNEVNEQYKQERDARLRLEEELARLRGASGKPSETEEPEAQQQAQSDEYDFDEADERYTQAIYDGEMEQAKAIRAEIRKQERIAAERAAEQVMQRKEAEYENRRVQEELQDVVAKAVETYPFLDAGNKDANQDAIDLVVAQRNVYLQRGMTPAQAIAKAVEIIGPQYSDAEPVVKKQSLTAKKKASIENNLKRADRIPSNGAGVGERARTTDYAALSPEEFSAMSDAEKRKARGDYL